MKKVYVIRSQYRSDGIERNSYQAKNVEDAIKQFRSDLNDEENAMTKIHEVMLFDNHANYDVSCKTYFKRMYS